MLRASEAEHLIRVTQHALDDSNDFSAHHLRLSLVDTALGSDSRTTHSTEGHTYELGQDSIEHTEAPALTVRLQVQNGISAPSALLQQHSHILDIVYAPNMIPSPSSMSSTIGTFIANQLQDIFSEEQAILSSMMPQSGGGGSIKRSASEGSSGIARRSTRSLKYAPTYHLTFSLFTPSAFPSAWDIEEAIEEIFAPLLSSLSPISNFTIDTQAQPYATFSPSVQPLYSEIESAWMLGNGDLGAFINAAEWPLSPSIGEGPTVNFILYVASPSQTPLMIEGHDSNSWLIPQWGGVFILNLGADATRHAGTNPAVLTASDLQAPLLTFSLQLLSLLGLPDTPTISLPLRLSTLARVRAASLFLSASSTLGSLARLVSALPSISIPDSVAKSVSSTLEHLDAACGNFRSGDFESALQNARMAEQRAEKAFFERSMVGQVYFPDEHKVAVYLPLLGPMAVPLIMSAAKEIMPFVGRKLRRRRG